MAKRPRRNHTRLSRRGWPCSREGEKTIVELAQQFDVHPPRSRNGAISFPMGLRACSMARRKTTTPAPTVDVKTLHAKIGELTLEDDFLSGALGKPAF